MIDLTDHLARKKIVLQIEQDIDAFCRAEFDEEPRTHLGASIIGHDCQAYGWNTFRWLKQETFDGRMLRLFNRGHEEERRFVRWLEGIGFEVRELDPETKKQFRIVGAKGHFGGSLDAMAKAPAKYGLPDWLVLLGEFKTHSDKSFKKLKKSGVKGSKPVHYKQMCSYGRAYNFKYGLYCAVNKNDDELHFEIVELDYLQADDLFRKAEGIVFRQTQPPKIANTKTFFDCKYCDFAGICHDGEAPVKNCRSCVNAIPVDNAEWQCQFYNAIIPKHIIPVGCEHYKAIIN